MTKRRKLLAYLIIVVSGVLLTAIIMQRDVVIVVDGKEHTLHTNALTVGMALRTAGLNPQPFDSITPGVSAWLRKGTIIHFNHASRIHIWSPKLGLLEPFYSTEKIPITLLALANIKLEPEDQVLWNGLEIALNEPLPQSDVYTLQLKLAEELNVLNTGTGQKITIRTAEESVGRVLWDKAFFLCTADSLSIPLNQPVIKTNSIAFEKATPIYIQDEGIEVVSLASSANIGQALAGAGVSLQGLDYSIPAEEMPLPSDGVIHVTKVSEKLIVEQQTIAFAVDRQPDPDMIVGQEVFLEEGRTGLQINQIRVRYEDQREENRYPVIRWVASNPQSQLVSYGTKVISQPVDTPSGTQDYWAAIEMYATSYYPCGFANGRCSYITASGRTLEKGIVALTLEWYKALKGMQVYVPGYGFGIIADTGAGIPGKNWIDLGYGNEDYVPWSRNVTVYFMNPPPEEIPWFLK